MKGINRALFSKNYILNEVMNNPYKPCIFLSHKSDDKTMVKNIQSFIHSFGIDTYLDENDENLQVAVRNNDYKKITEAIQNGIKNSTHIMCFISTKTQNSWWVPYELGYGDSNNKKIATLKLQEVSSMMVPEYLKIHTYLENRTDLKNYIFNILKSYSALYENYGTNVENYYKYNNLEDSYKIYKYID